MTVEYDDHYSTLNMSVNISRHVRVKEKGIKRTAGAENIHHMKVYDVIHVLNDFFKSVHRRQWHIT